MTRQDILGLLLGFHRNQFHYSTVAIMKHAWRIELSAMTDYDYRERGNLPCIRSTMARITADWRCILTLTDPPEARGNGFVQNEDSETGCLTYSFHLLNMFLSRFAPNSRSVEQWEPASMTMMGLSPFALTCWSSRTECRYGKHILDCVDDSLKRQAPEWGDFPLRKANQIGYFNKELTARPVRLII